jgi:hypothetical protein
VAATKGRSSTMRTPRSARSAKSHEGCTRNIDRKYMYNDYIMAHNTEDRSNDDFQEEQNDIDFSVLIFII